MRTKVTKIIIIFLFIWLALVLFWHQVIRGSFYNRLSKKNCIRLIAEDGNRGKIVDRNNKALAENRISFNVSIIQPEFNLLSAQEKEKIISKLSQVLGKSEESIRKILKKPLAPFAPLVIGQDITKEKLIILEENKIFLPSVVIQAAPMRYYPHEKLVCHVLGYVNKIDRSRLAKLKEYGYTPDDLVGYSGIEEKLDQYLRAESGGLQIEVDRKGRQIRTLGYRSPNEGKTVQLTIDLEIQKIVEEALTGKNGSIIVMNPETGEILALVNNPGFDPNIFISSAERERVKNVLANKSAPFLNRAVASSYPLGSVFKIITGYAGLDTKKISLNTTYFCQGKMMVGKKEFKCWDTHEIENLFDAFKHSCDIYFYHTGLLAGPDNLSSYAAKFGLGKKTDIDLAGETSGFIPSVMWKRIKRMQKWFDGDTANFAIGQGDVLVSPIQSVKMMAVLATNGKLITPYVIKAIDGKELNYPKPIQGSFSLQILSFIKEGLRRSISEETGTAHIIYTPQLSIVGKTGSAQAGIGKLAHGWFVGFCPANNPKMVFCVFLEHGAAGYYAVLVAKQMLERFVQEGLL